MENGTFYPFKQLNHARALVIGDMLRHVGNAEDKKLNLTYVVRKLGVCGLYY